MPAIRVKHLPLSRLKPAAYNPRRELRPGDPIFEQLRASIEALGCVQHLIWNERTGNLVGGHQTYGVLRHLGYTSADVSVVALDEPRERALNVALNRCGGGWDRAKLAELVGRLDDDLVALGGFADGDLERIAGAGDGDGPGGGGGGRTGGGDDDDPGEVTTVPQSYQVLVKCDSEAQQLDVYERVREAGYKARASTLH